MASNSNKWQKSQNHDFKVESIEPAEFSTVGKNSFIDFFTNRTVLASLFALSTISVLALVGLVMYVNLKKSEIDAKADQTATKSVAGVESKTLNEEDKSKQSTEINTTQDLKVDVNNTNDQPTEQKKVETIPKDTSEKNISAPEAPAIKEIIENKSNIQFRQLTAQDFNDILINQVFENTLEPKIETTITGDVTADRHIYNIAESRGYRFWPQADVSKLVEIQPNIKLQPNAASAFLEMKEAAKKDGVIISIVSGYRSQTEQNLIFRPRFEALEMAELGGYYDPVDLARGEADSLIYRALALTAPAGYSRHHTGYAIDFADLSPDNTTTVFNGSKAYKWLSDNNYQNARKYGFVPSYPNGLQNVGPEPEAWEYMWVGDSAK